VDGITKKKAKERISYFRIVVRLSERTVFFIKEENQKDGKYHSLTVCRYEFRLRAKVQIDLLPSLFTFFDLRNSKISPAYFR